MVDLDGNPMKLIEVIRDGRRMAAISRSLTGLALGADLAKYAVARLCWSSFQWDGSLRRYASGRLHVQCADRPGDTASDDPRNAHAYASPEGQMSAALLWPRRLRGDAGGDPAPPGCRSRQSGWHDGMPLRLRA